MRGQADAPIELVIAIIIMVTSLGLAFFVINNTNTDKCLAQLKTQTQQLQEAILDVGLGSEGTTKTVRFSMPTCGDKTVTGIEFVKFDSPAFCQVCPGHYNGCWQIVPVAKTKDGLTQVQEAATCIELPAERVSIQGIGQDAQGNACEGLQPNPCPDDSTDSCQSQLGIPPTVFSSSSGSQNPSTWQTLGSVDSSTHLQVRNYLLVFNKVLDITDPSGHTQIQLCAKACTGAAGSAC